MKGSKDNVSGIIHLITAFVSLIGLVFLVSNATLYGEGLVDVVSFSIFGISMILLYGASATYHLVAAKSKLLRKIDHIMIYVLIAGTYTPILIGPIGGILGWVMLSIIWFIVVLGIFIKIFWFHAPRWVSTGTYLFMGWIVLIIIYPLIKNFISLNVFNSLFWLLLGGIFYTIGGVIYGLKKPDFKSKYFGFHELFHIFIVLGSLCHYWFIIHYVLYI